MKMHFCVFRSFARGWRKVRGLRYETKRKTDGSVLDSTAIVPLAGGAREGGKGDWGRHLLVRAAGHGGHPYAQVERHHSRPGQRTRSPSAYRAIVDRFPAEYSTWSQSVHENRIYCLLIDCDVSYPDSPPVISFLTAINLPCVNQTTGKVGHSRFSSP